MYKCPDKTAEHPSLYVGENSMFKHATWLSLLGMSGPKENKCHGPYKSQVTNSKCPDKTADNHHGMRDHIVFFLNFIKLFMCL